MTLLCLLLPVYARAQVFVVGEKTATADLSTEFHPTRMSLPDAGLTERGMRELERNLDGEQGFAHRALPMGAGLTLEANGQLKPGPDGYRKMIYEKGQAAAAGDRVAITSLKVAGDRIILDLNGGPYLKHRFLRHLEVNGMQVANDGKTQATGARITLTFEGGVPDISAAEVKALLEPVIDFGVKTTEQAYGEAQPAPVKEAISEHDVKVGMNHRMVLAALGQPESKVREHDEKDPDGPRYEEWIYGHVPQTVRFIRFEGDRVSMVKVAAPGQQIAVRTQDELDGYLPPAPTREIAMGDAPVGDPAHRPTPPTLLKPGDKVDVDGEKNGAVQMPPEKKEKVQPIPAPPSSSEPGMAASKPTLCSPMPQ
ncbi:hypothetical protein [Granulicella rosea]|uniref:hypothetical protein n=1 Tax=Granulicella rosea TaxID=474952 RepID=UPI003CCBBBBA